MTDGTAATPQSPREPENLGYRDIGFVMGGCVVSWSQLPSFFGMPMIQCESAVCRATAPVQHTRVGGGGGRGGQPTPGSMSGCQQCIAYGYCAPPPTHTVPIHGDLGFERLAAAACRCGICGKTVAPVLGGWADRDIIKSLK